MWKKWKFWDNVYKKSMLRAFARSRAKKIEILRQLFEFAKIPKFPGKLYEEIW